MNLPGTLKTTLLWVIGFSFFACSGLKKSELVQRLESIFYNSSFATIPETQFSVADWGAAGDGETLDTKAIQAAIDSAAKHGGGIVTFPKGTYLSGALFVKSNVELRIDEGVTIKAIQDDSQYPDVWTRISGIEMYWPAALINVYKQKNVRVTGKGVIDGNGKYWWDKFWGDPPRSGGMYTDYVDRGLRWAVDFDCKRVRAVVAYGSDDVMFKDFTVKRSGFWTVTMTYCNRVYVDGIIIRNNIGGFGPSSDGINTDSSSDILVENCDIDCNDDNLCIKAGRDWDGLRVNRPAENIVYRNSITRSGHGLITLGSETSGGIRNVEVYGLKAIGTTMGIRFKSAKVRGGLMENIKFHDIEMDRVAYPFHFELNWYPAFSYPVIPEDIPEESYKEHWITMTKPVQPPERGIPEFRNLTISEVTVKNAGQAFYVNAYEEKLMNNVYWKNVSIEADKPGEISHALDWTMDNVKLSIPGETQIAMTNVKNVPQPHYILRVQNKADKRVVVELQENLSTEKTKDDEAIVVIDENNKKISPDDTLFSQKITMVIHPAENNAFRFFEPWGDNVVVSPVDVSLNLKGDQLSVKGERTHNWVFYIKTPENPEGVSGADSWEYYAENQWLKLEKEGSKFNIRVPGIK